MIAALSVSALVALAQSAAHPLATESPEPDYIAVYRSEGDGRGVAVSGRDRNLNLFYGAYRPEVWETDWGGLFKIEYADGIGYERFTGISLPADISATPSWSAHGKQCKSRNYFDGKWLVECSGRTNSVYIYDKSVGITGFYFPCADKMCWYKLETKKGIFSDVIR